MKKLYSLLLVIPFLLLGMGETMAQCANSLTIGDENPPCPLQDVTFNWAEQSPAAEYRLKIGTTPGGQEEAVIGTPAIGTNETYTTSTPLFEGATYYATVEYTLDGGTTFTPCDTLEFDIRVLPTDPTGITLEGGDNVSDVCNGETFLLIATGGTEGTLGTYEWSTDNFATTIGGETDDSLTVVGGISVGTTYYVRRVDGDCGATSGSTSLALTVSGGVFDPISETEQTIVSGATVCPGTNNPDLTFATVANAPAANTDILWELHDVTGGGDVTVATLADVATFNVNLNEFTDGGKDFEVHLINQSCPHGDFTEETFAFSTNDVPTYTAGFDGFSAEELGVAQVVNAGNTVVTICDGQNLVVDMQAIGAQMGTDLVNTTVELYNVSTASTIDGPDNLVVWAGNDSVLTVVDVFAAAASDGDIIEIRVNRCGYGGPAQISSRQFTLQQSVGGDATGSSETYTREDNVTVLANSDEVCPGELIDIDVTGAANLGTNGEYRVYKTVDAGATFTLIANGTDPLNVVNHDHGLFDAQYHVVIVNDCDSVPVSSISINVKTVSTAPTSVTADMTSPVCPGTTVRFTANGGVLGTGGIYQYSTDNGATWTTTTSAGADAFVDLIVNTATTVLFRIQDDCGNHPASAPFAQMTMNVHTVSTAPTGITAAPAGPVCPGTTVTFTATGGTLGTNAVYQYSTDGGTTWDTTLNAGADAFIDLVLNASTTTDMRIFDTCDAAIQTTVQSASVTVETVSTAPTTVSASPAADTVCAGTLVTYTANGGALGTGNAGYEYSTDGGTTWNATGNAGLDDFIDITVNTFTKVHMRITDDCGVYPTSNEPFDSTEVYTENVAPTTLTPDDAGPVCDGDSVTFTADGSLGNRGDEQYEYSTDGGTTWTATNNGGKDNFIKLELLVTTTVDMRISGGCTDVSATVVSSTVMVWAALNPITSTTKTNDDYCANNAIDVTVSAFYGAQPANAFVAWYTIDTDNSDTTLYKRLVNTDPESDTVVVSPTTNTTYGVRIESDCDTTAFSVETIIVKDTSAGPLAVFPGDINFGSPILICDNTLFAFEADEFILGEGASFEWSFDSDITPGGESVQVSMGGAVFNAFTDFGGQGAATFWSSEGTYYVKARIVGECNATDFAIAQVYQFDEDYVQTFDDVVCAGGTVNLNDLVQDPFGSQMAAEASVSNMTFSGEGVSGTTFTHSTAGLYTITVVVQHETGCSVTETFEIEVLENATINVDPNSIIASDCNGPGTGAFSMTVTDGLAPYTVILDGGAQVVGGVAAGQVVTFNNLTNGTHNIEVIDDNGCSTLGTVIIPNTSGLLLSVDPDNTTSTVCFGENNGTVTLEATGGTPAYVYAISIDGGTTYGVDQASNVFNGLSPFITYWFRVTDADGCQSFTNHTMNENSELDLLVFDYTDQSCADSEDGSMNFLASGGVAPYEFSLDTGNTFFSETFVDGLAAGTYRIRVRDAIGCEADFVFSLEAPAPIAVTHDTLAGNPEDGFDIRILASGGTGGFEYSLNGGDFTTDNVFEGLLPGAYVVTVRDDSGCEVTYTFRIEEPSGILEVESGISFTAYPNPFNGVITLKGDDMQNATITMTDVFGKQVTVTTTVDANEVKVATGDIASGVYLIHVSTDNGRATQRVIKK